MKKKWFVWMAAAFLAGGCHTEKKEEISRTFGREDFPLARKLENPEEIRIDSLLDPAAAYLYRDDYLVIGNQSHCDYLIEIYSLKDKQIVARLAPRGNGPGEVTSCFCYASSSEDNLFNFKDMQTGIYYRINLDSSLVGQAMYVENRFPYDSNTHPNTETYMIGDRHYVGYTMWYLDDSTYSNSVAPLSLYKIGADDAPQNPTDYAYFVAPVNEAHLLVDAPAREIWLADSHKDKISLYDDSLRLKKVLVGPDRISLTYTMMESDLPMPFISFPENKYYGAYLGGTVTSDHVYMIYEGIKGRSYDPQHLQPVEVFKFDKKGNPVCRYQLDRYVYTISIDREENYMYATSRKGAGEQAEFLRYKL